MVSEKWESGCEEFVGLKLEIIIIIPTRVCVCVCVAGWTDTSVG